MRRRGPRGRPAPGSARMSARCTTSRRRGCRLLQLARPVIGALQAVTGVGVVLHEALARRLKVARIRVFVLVRVRGERVTEDHYVTVRLGLCRGHRDEKEGQ